MQWKSHRSRKSMLGGLLLIILTASMSTAVVQPGQPVSAVAETDCGGLEGYIQALVHLRDDYRRAFTERLDDVSPEWEITGAFDPETMNSIDSGADGMAWMAWGSRLSKAELTILSELWNDRASQLRALEPPPVAKDLHDNLISSAEFLSDFYRLSATNGWVTAMMLTMVGGDDGASSPTKLSNDLAALCPEWAVFQAHGTPIPQ